MMKFEVDKNSLKIVERSPDVENNEVAKDSSLAKTKMSPEVFCDDPFWAACSFFQSVISGEDSVETTLTFSSNVSTYDYRATIISGIIKKVNRIVSINRKTLIRDLKNENKELYTKKESDEILQLRLDVYTLVKDLHRPQVISLLNKYHIPFSRKSSDLELKILYTLEKVYPGGYSIYLADVDFRKEAEILRANEKKLSEDLNHQVSENKDLCFQLAEKDRKVEELSIEVRLKEENILYLRTRREEKVIERRPDKLLVMVLILLFFIYFFYETPPVYIPNFSHIRFPIHRTFSP